MSLLRRYIQSKTPNAVTTLSQSLAAVEGLERNLAGPANGAAIVHYCPLGCHTSPDAALEEIAANLQTVGGAGNRDLGQVVG